jgi:hypothetical protein
MEADPVYRAAVAFFDQFISRGAASDVRQLRDRLVADEHTKQELLDQLSGDADEREAFTAFRRFVTEEATRQGPRGTGDGPDLAELASWTDYSWGDGETTSDPAQWHDWLASVAATNEPV